MILWITEVGKTSMLKKFLRTGLGVKDDIIRKQECISKCATHAVVKTNLSGFDVTSMLALGCEYAIS